MSSQKMSSTSLDCASERGRVSIRKVLVPPHLIAAQSLDRLLEVDCELYGAPSLDGLSGKNLAMKGKFRSDVDRELMKEGDEFHQEEAGRSKIT